MHREGMLLGDAVVFKYGQKSLMYLLSQDGVYAFPLESRQVCGCFDQYNMVK